MKKIIFILALCFSTQIFACQRCVDSMVEYIIDHKEAFKKEIEEIPKDDVLKLCYTEAFDLGMRYAMKDACNILHHYHPELHLTIDQWEKIRDDGKWP